MYIIARLHGQMWLHPSSFVAYYLKGAVSREERVCTYIIARLHGRMGLHPSSFAAFYLKGAVSQEERAYTQCISLLNVSQQKVHG